jgi:hypothetical protein
MALSQYSWSTTAKLALPLLVMMAIAAAPSVSGAAQVEQNGLPEPEEQAAPVATAGRGRFWANYDDEIPLTSRRLLTDVSINICSKPPLYYNCSQAFPFFQNATCCKDPVTLISSCFDVGVLNLKCGSCTNQCAWNQVCCEGFCVNLQNDPNCINSLCGYNGGKLF